MTKEDLLNMELHEEIYIQCADHDVIIRRVFGGWIYTDSWFNTQTDSMDAISTCFVPEVINVEAYTTDIRNKKP